jgi:hypothetical protein
LETQQSRKNAAGIHFTTQEKQRIRHIYPVYSQGFIQALLLTPVLEKKIQFL